MLIGLKMRGKEKHTLVARLEKKQKAQVKVNDTCRANGEEYVLKASMLVIAVMGTARPR